MTCQKWYRVLNTEKAILSSINEGKNTVDPLTDKATVEAKLNSKETEFLTQGQKSAISLINTTKDRFIMIQGLAGTGKSTMLQYAQELSKNHEFVGLAPTHQAVKELSAKNINSQTVKSLLHDHKDKSNIDFKNKVFVLDESSMLSNKDFKSMLDLMVRTDSRVVFVGDKQQQESIESGAPHRLVEEHSSINKVTMPDIRRQKDEQSLKGVQANYAGDPHQAHEHFSKQESIDKIEYEKNSKDIEANKQIKLSVNESGKDNMLPDVANEYLSRTKECREQTMVIANSHNERSELHGIIRQGLKDKGEIGKDKLIVNRLINRNESPTLMKSINTYNSKEVLQIGDIYHMIDSVDKANKNITITNLEDNKQKTISPVNMNHQYNGLFKMEQSDLVINDKVIE
jgi:ATP-dependent exoDNAse (exonuclease V) alpha subunit